MTTCQPSQLCSRNKGIENYYCIRSESKYLDNNYSNSIAMVITIILLKRYKFYLLWICRDDVIQTATTLKRWQNRNGKVGLWYSWDVGLSIRFVQNFSNIGQVGFAIDRHNLIVVIVEINVQQICFYELRSERNVLNYDNFKVRHYMFYRDRRTHTHTHLVI